MAKVIKNKKAVSKKDIQTAWELMIRREFHLQHGHNLKMDIQEECSYGYSHAITEEVMKNTASRTWEAAYSKASEYHLKMERKYMRAFRALKLPLDNMKMYHMFEQEILSILHDDSKLVLGADDVKIPALKVSQLKKLQAMSK